MMKNIASRKLKMKLVKSKMLKVLKKVNWPLPKLMSLLGL
jgi:hypothetical protein